MCKLCWQCTLILMLLGTRKLCLPLPIFSRGLISIIVLLLVVHRIEYYASRYIIVFVSSHAHTHSYVGPHTDLDY